MAKLVYDAYTQILTLTESDRDRKLRNGDSKLGIGMGYRYCIFHDHHDNRQNTTDILKMFNKVITDKYGKIDIDVDVNPWLISLNHNLVVYFGEDKPVIKTKTIKSCTPSYKKWTGYNWKDPKKPETYYYAEVKNPDKLFIFGNTYRFPCHEGVETIDEEHYVYMTKFDLSDEVYEQKMKEKVQKDIEEKKRRDEYLVELDRRRHTPGYCEYCGSEYDVIYTPNPFDVEMNDDYTMHYMCHRCYEGALGDI